MTKPFDPDSLTKSLEGLRRYISDVTDNVILHSFDLGKCRDFDIRQRSDASIRQKWIKLMNSLKNCNVTHSDHYVSAFNTYNEMVVEDLLKSKANIKSKNEAIGAPDFIMTTKEGNEINVDLKTLNFADGGKNFREIQLQFTRSKIEIEEAQKRREKAFFESQAVTISPLKSSTRKDVIETLINRITELHKPSQLSYNNKKGILVIDTVLLDFPIFIQEALPYFLYPPLHTLISGCLWHTCFGKPGERTFEWVESIGQKNIGAALEKEGILTNGKSLQGIVFIIKSKIAPIIIGFYNPDTNDEGIFQCLFQLCDYVNDTENRQLKKPIPAKPFLDI